MVQFFYVKIPRITLKKIRPSLCLKAFISSRKMWLWIKSVSSEIQMYGVYSLTGILVYFHRRGGFLRILYTCNVFH